jgi:hypothetical protein
VRYQAFSGGRTSLRLLAGDGTMTNGAGLEPESKGRGFVLTCVGHASGNMRLDA